MTLIGTLWGDVRQRQSKIILSVAAINEFELAQPQWTFTNKPQEFTTKFPYGKIPTFEGIDGFKLTEGTSIARYLSSIGTKVNLLGFNAHESAIVDQWVHFAEHEICVPVQNITGVIYGHYTPFSLEERIRLIDKNAARLAHALTYLESHLAANSSGYVALDKLTLADFVLAGTIFAAASVTLGSVERAQYPYIFTHYEKVTGDEKVKSYWGTEEFVDVRITEPIPFL